MKKILITIIAFVAILIAVMGIAIATFDINKHRGQIEEALSKETGRAVKLGGEIHVGLSLKGLTLSIQDVAFGNPPWASRPNLATVKLFDLKVGLLPLLSHRVDITGLVIDDADILLESQGEYRHNWDMNKQANKEEPKTAAAKEDEASAPVAINLDSLSIKNSRIGIMAGENKTTIFVAESLTLGRQGGGIGLHFLGSLNGQTIKLALQTNADSLLSKASRPLDLSLAFANYYLTAKGKVNAGDKKAFFDTYELVSKSSKISGAFKLVWDGARPEILGTVLSEKLDPADFKMDAPSGPESGNDKPAVSATASQRMFSDTPLPLASLKSADVHFDITVNSLAAGSVELQNLKAKLVVNDGRLAISPITMKLGSGTISGQVNLDAAAVPAKASTGISVSDVDWRDLIKVWGAEAFLSGKVKADISVASTGNSMHELASNLGGPITLIGAGGDVVTTASNKIMSGLNEILAPGSGKSEGMNCLVTRFLAQNGVVKGNGILIDTMAATVAGYGDIDLRSETLNLDFHAKPKVVGIGGFLPTLHIGGTLKQPDIGASAQSMVQNVGNLLTGGTMNDPVPDLVTQQGQNACVYTLDHPSASASSAAKSGVVQDIAGKAGNLIKGLFGK